MITSITGIIQELTFNLVSILSKEIIQEIIHDIRTSLQIDINPEIIIISHFIRSIRQCRVECTQQSMNSILRNLPNAEESQNMVDTIQVKIFRHFTHTVFPPLESVLLHFFPIICRESPILSQHRKIIRWCTCLTIHIEQIRIYPCICTGTTYANWNITLQNNIMFMCIVSCITKLFVQMILNKIIDIYFSFVFFNQFVNLLGIIN